MHPEQDAFFHRQLLEAETFLTRARAMIEGEQPEDLKTLVREYTQGACSYFDQFHHIARDLINQVARRAGILGEGQSLFDDSRAVACEFVRSLCPELIPSLYGARSNDGLEIIPLLESSPNELADGQMPPPMNMLLHQTRRPSMCAYVTGDASLYAHPFRYQVLSKERSAMWVSGSPRGLSRDAIGATELISVDKDIVVLQDRFNFTAISHFLFDGITRALLLEQALGTLRSSLLVFGGVPGEYHAAVCHALCETLALSPENLVFPDHPVTFETSRQCIWFSDQVETYVHPAQMAHPTSIGLLRSVIDAMPGERSDLRRVYLRGPAAGYLRISNEEQLVHALEQRGFAAVPFSAMSVVRQVGLFRDAEIIVGPHGSELTHLIAANELRSVVELFSPLGGIDAYAFIARAGNIEYTSLVGNGDAAGFAVDVERIGQLVDMAAPVRVPPLWRKPANLLAGTRAFAGFDAAPVDEARDAFAPPEMIWGNAVMVHQTDPQGLAGRYHLEVPLVIGARYTASCWIWIPPEFDDNEIVLWISECAVVEVIGAELSRRMVWQRIATTATALGTHCVVELRLVGGASAILATTCWQLERGSSATTYVGTP